MYRLLIRVPFTLPVVALAFIVTSAANSADWPQFRGVNGIGVSAEKDLPTNWDDGRNVIWKAELPGFGSSSPIALGERLYLTCYSGYGVDEENSGQMEDLRLHVVCVNKADGKMIWDKEFRPTLPESTRVRDHGYAAATPATDGSDLYVFFGKTGVVKLGLDGEKIWQTSVGDEVHGWGCGTSPVLFKDLVIVNASVESGELIGINKLSGEIVWRADGMKSSWNTPHLVQLPDGKTELVVSVRDEIRAYDPATGVQLWKCDGIEDYVCPSVISRDGIVYCIGGRKSRCIAVRAGGRGDVTDTHVQWEAPAGANVSSPVIYGDHLYWVSDRNNTAYCLRLEDGEILYRRRFPGQPYASTVAADGKLYVVTRYDGTFVLAATPEYQQLAHNELGDDSTFNASPIISDGRLFLRSDKYLYCIGSSKAD